MPHHRVLHRVLHLVLNLVLHLVLHHRLLHLARHQIRQLVRRLVQARCGGRRRDRRPSSPEVAADAAAFSLDTSSSGRRSTSTVCGGPSPRTSSTSRVLASRRRAAGRVPLRGGGRYDGERDRPLHAGLRRGADRRGGHAGVRRPRAGPAVSNILLFAVYRPSRPLFASSRLNTMLFVTPLPNTLSMLSLFAVHRSNG